MLELNTLLHGRYRVLAVKSEHENVTSYEAYDSERSALVQLWAWPHGGDERPLSTSLAPFFADSGLLRPVLLDSFTTEDSDVAVVDTRQDETAIARFDEFVRRAGLAGGTSSPKSPASPTIPMASVESDDFGLESGVGPIPADPEPAPEQAGTPLPVWEPPVDQDAAPPPTPPNNRRWLYLLGGAGFVACCLVPLCCVLFANAFTPQLEEFTDELEALLTPTVPAENFPSSDVEGETITVFDLEVGDCLYEPGEGLDTEVTRVPCDAPHTHEVFGVIDYDEGDGDFPGEDVLRDFADEECLMAFEAYVGLDYQQSDLYFSTLYPSPDTWDEGDRVIDCVLYEPDVLLEGSMRDSFR